MPTAKYFSRCPPFPTDVPVVDVPTISLERLEEGSEDDLKVLFEACREYGFFRLDLCNCLNGKELLNLAERMLDLGAETLSLDQQTLDKFAYNPPKTLMGYKSAGRLKTDDGKMDAIEMYTLGQDDVLSTSPFRENPAPIEARRSECQEFIHSAGKIIACILTALDKSLQLPRGTLAALCDPTKPSDTGVRMLMSQPTSASDQANKRITLGGHTDIGTITMLFNVLGGLQILPATADNTFANWRFIEPKQGTAIVNMGDTIVEWTGGVLRSSLHRVVNPPGQQADAVRQSLAYLVRPERDATMKRLTVKESLIPPLGPGEKDEAMSATEWVAERVLQIGRGELRPRTTGGRPIAVNGST